MRAYERKPVLVFLHLRYRNVPSQDGVAFRAVRAHLSLVHIVVAVLALFSNIGENRLYMALNALYLFVHSAKRISRLVVIKFRNRPNRLPSRGRVTILTGHS